MSTSNSAVTMVSEETQSPLRYTSDLIDEEWEILQPVISELEPYTTGRPRMTEYYFVDGWLKEPLLGWFDHVD